jgi:hypothetical protein
MDVSFLLPTNRAQTHPEVLRQSIYSINSHHPHLDYEILVYSQHPVEGDNVTWVREKGATGPLRGFNFMAAEIAEGDYLVCVTDDHAFANTVSLCIDALEGPVFQERKYKVIGLNPDGPSLCKGVCPIPQKGDLLGDEVISQQISPAFTLRFPVVRKDTLATHLSDHIFHPDLFYHAGDIWLGYFLHCKGEPTYEGPTHLKEIASLKDPSYEVRDCNVVHSLIKNHIAGCTDYLPSHY